MDIQRLSSYLHKVAQDAFASENKQPDAELKAWLLDHDTLFILLPTKYQRVRTRVFYRLERNLQKNFGISMAEHRFYRQDIDKPALVVDDHYVEAGYTVGSIQVGARTYLIHLTAVGNKSNRLKHGLKAETSSKVWEAVDALRARMESVGGKLYYYDRVSTAYGRYRDDYMKAFGEYPYAIDIQQIV